MQLKKATGKFFGSNLNLYNIDGMIFVDAYMFDSKTSNPNLSVPEEPVFKNTLHLVVLSFPATVDAVELARLDDLIKCKEDNGDDVTAKGLSLLRNAVDEISWYSCEYVGYYPKVRGNNVR